MLCLTDVRKDRETAFDMCVTIEMLVEVVQVTDQRSGAHAAPWHVWKRSEGLELWQEPSIRFEASCPGNQHLGLAALGSSAR